MDYYVEFGGGLGDVFQQIYESGQYNALLRLGADDHCHVAIISHNPHVTELFDHHPSADRLTVQNYGYWLPEDDSVQRPRHGLPAPGTAQPPPGVFDPVTFYPAPDDLIRLCPLSGGRPYVIFSASAGLSERDLPADAVRQAHRAVLEAGFTPVYVGRDYERFGRHEQRAVEGGVDLINRLGVPGVARLVQAAAGVVCCHSSVNMLAWCERLPLLLLYPPSVWERHFNCRDQWACGADFPECVHGTFEQFGPDMTGRFLDLLRGTADIRIALLRLPHTRNPHNGEDYRRSDWFIAPDAYPRYVQAAAVIRPASILEVGSLLGFGLVSFARGCPGSPRLHSVDDESYIPGSRTLCQENLRHAGLDVECFESLNETRGHRYDLIHVDGDHSKEGAILDLAHCWALRPRVMLVDDYLFQPEVREAVHVFARRMGLPFKVWHSYRSWAVFADASVLSCLPDELS